MTITAIIPAYNNEVSIRAQMPIITMSQSIHEKRIVKKVSNRGWHDRRENIVIFPKGSYSYCEYLKDIRYVERR